MAYNEIEQKIVSTFMNLVNDGFPAKDAVLTLDYWIFVKYAHEFDKLNEEEQMDVRRVLHSLKLVHI